ncbi:2-phosphosulfolactate phosphatase family protein [Barrientosiimonas marina]|uniref:Probable 2-phosphosulfolactate phosphatase n=1 Tax=Lentibacillus kimchii TaxID=1542911 RepID=A0ABW2UQB0_9BACI
MKIHLLWKKEEIDEYQISGNKIAVVFDVLLATSTIASCLASGAKEVIPVLDKREALDKAKTLNHASADDVLLAGESDGLTIEGFLNPVPSALNERVSGKTVILSTTNGTVAIRQAASAKKVYTASLLNGAAVGKRIVNAYEDETIVVVCSGSRNTFCLEDYYGAGYFVTCLINEFGQENVDLTDSALSATLLFEHMSDQAVSILEQSAVGGMLSKYGLYDDVAYVSQLGKLDVVPLLNNAVNSLSSEIIDRTATNEGGLNK